MQAFGRILVSLGAILLVIGGVMLASARAGLPLGRLPGDFAIRGRNFAFYAPIGTCLVVSVVLSLIFWLVNYLRR